MNDEQSPIVRFGFAVGAFFCLVGGPISGYFLTMIFLEAQASGSWPAVSGTILKAEVGTTGVDRYFADVRYNYRVGANEFTGSRIRASDGEFDVRDGAEQAIRGLSVGQAIPVFYNPTDPKQALLKPGVGFQEYALLLVPFIMFGFGVWSFHVLWRTRRPR